MKQYGMIHRYLLKSTCDYTIPLASSALRSRLYREVIKNINLNELLGTFCSLRSQNTRSERRKGIIYNLKKIAMVLGFLLFIMPTTIICLSHPTSTPTRAGVLALYQLMKDTHELFTNYGIEYWIDGGTLLGAVRNKGLIEWDDDLDIDIYKTESTKVIALTPIFAELGYTLAPVFFGFKLYATNGTPVPHEWFKSPCLDIFCMVKQDNRITFDPAVKICWALRDGKPFYHRQEELYPLAPYTFGMVTVWGPHNPCVYLQALYGPEWFTTGYKYDAVTKKKERWILTDRDRQPAQPVGPLEDRVI